MAEHEIIMYDSHCSIFFFFLVQSVKMYCLNLMEI